MWNQPMQVAGTMSATVESAQAHYILKLISI